MKIITLFLVLYILLNMTVVDKRNLPHHHVKTQYGWVYVTNGAHKTHRWTLDLFK